MDAWLTAMDDRTELLLVAYEHASGSLIEATLRAGGLKILSRLPPRIFVVAGGSPEVVEETVRLLDVEAVAGDTVELPADLSETEHLFVTAWLASRRTTRRRRGDGLAWDAPGFTPPDREGRG